MRGQWSNTLGIFIKLGRLVYGMLWRKGKKKEPRLEHFVRYDVKWEPVTQEQIDAFQQRQELWEYLNDRNARYGANKRRYHSYPVDDPFYKPLRESEREIEKADAEFQRMVDEFDRPIREMEAELAKIGAPKIKLGDIKVEDGRTYMVTGVNTQYGVRMIQDS